MTIKFRPKFSLDQAERKNYYTEMGISSGIAGRGTQRQGLTPRVDLSMTEHVKPIGMHAGKTPWSATTGSGIGEIISRINFNQKPKKERKAILKL